MLVLPGGGGRSWISIQKNERDPPITTYLFFSRESINNLGDSCASQSLMLRLSMSKNLHTRKYGCTCFMEVWKQVLHAFCAFLDSSMQQPLQTKKWNSQPEPNPWEWSHKLASPQYFQSRWACQHPAVNRVQWCRTSVLQPSSTYQSATA